MENGRERHALRGIVAGAAAGLAASWVMNRFMSGPGQKLQESLKSDEEKINDHVQRLQAEQRGGDREPKQDATMKAADALVATATGGQHLSFEQQEAAGPMVHYGFGALVGGLYGALAEYSSTVRLGLGTGFGAALFAGADLTAVPAFHLGPSVSEIEPKALANPLAAHLVYGATTELLRQVFRAMLWSRGTVPGRAVFSKNALPCLGRVKG